MKILLPLLIMTSLYAANIEITGPCFEEPLHQRQLNSDLNSIGDATITFLNQNNIAYIGSAAGISSIEGSPIGREAIEVISPNELRAYGWCYQVNGFEPAAMPDQIPIKKGDKVWWFFAYSTYQDGQWKDYCTPSYQVKPDFICR